MKCANQLGFFDAGKPQPEVAKVERRAPRPMVSADVSIACPCSFRPFPHILTDELAVQRHRRGEAH